jgi:hypothetical protein
VKYRGRTTPLLSFLPSAGPSNNILLIIEGLEKGGQKSDDVPMPGKSLPKAENLREAFSYHPKY